VCPWQHLCDAKDQNARNVMRNMILAAGLVLSALATPTAKAEDTRTAVDLPPDVRTQFLEHMRTHMNALNDVVQLMAQGKIREAGSTARKEMAIGQGQGFGRYMPPEFREMGFEYHRAADDFARIASEVPEPPDAAGWSKLVDGLAKITVRCNACHAVFRVK
jgi:hypothetical protein